MAPKKLHTAEKEREEEKGHQDFRPYIMSQSTSEKRLLAAGTIEKNKHWRHGERGEGNFVVDRIRQTSRETMKEPAREEEKQKTTACRSPKVRRKNYFSHLAKDKTKSPIVRAKGKRGERKKRCPRHLLHARAKKSISRFLQEEKTHTDRGPQTRTRRK